MLWGAAKKVSGTVAGQIDGSLNEFREERNRALAEAQWARAASAIDARSASPPWTVLAEQYQILENDLEVQARQLSRHHNTFLEAPTDKDVAGLTFDFQQMLPTCMAALEADEDLRRMRFELVPQR